MSRQRILTTVLACAVSAAIGGTAWADDIEITASDIILRKVIYNPDFDPTVPESELIIPNPDSPSGVFVKNVSHNPEFASAKAKMNAATIYVPARKADGTLLNERVDGDSTDCIVGDVVKDADGTLDDTYCQVQPIVVSYEEEVEGHPGVSDVYVAISLDDGATYKKYNLSKSADRSSFTTADGVVKYGDSRKPVQQVKGNYIAVAWTDKFCSAGRPAYAEVDEVTGEPVYEDLFGVRGSQGSIDYDADPETEPLGLGEVPFSCVWASRVTMNKLGGLDGKPVFQVYKAERLTSGTRDALQLFMGGAGGAGFGIAWHEDPDGLRPGGGDGPGDGFSGATTNNQTDVWYSWVGWGPAFHGIDTADESSGDPQGTNEDGTPRVRALNPWSMPVRITDNASCNADNFDSPGRPWCAFDSDEDVANGTDFCEYFETIGEGEDAKDICVTPDGRLLNGDTGASRPNLFLQPYTDLDGNTIGAWAIVAYEETKGLGEYVPDYCDGNVDASDEEKALCDNFYALFQGKDVYYHSFDFKSPEVISPGLRVNLPYVDPDGDRVYLDEDSAYTPGLFPGDARYLTENARRIRFILQGAGMIPVKPHRTSLLALWKQGIDGKGGPSDIMMARMRARNGSLPSDKKYDPYENPYDARNFVCEEEGIEGDRDICLDGRVQNLSAVTPTAFSVGTNGSELVSDWQWTCGFSGEDLVEPCNLLDQSYDNPYDNAIAHRGQIRGDFVVLGFSWTPNWAAARNANDNYNFYVRRSFDGGKTWTTDPKGPATVQHCERDLIAQGEGAALNCFDVDAGMPEPPRNVSLLKNNKFTVAEPRIVSPPGTIKACAKTDGTAIPCIPEDVLAKNVVFISYGTAVNADSNVNTDEELDEEEPIGRPADLFYARTTDFASTFEYADFGLTVDGDGVAIDHTDPEVTWDWTALAKDQGGIFSQQGEAQLRSTPAGNYFYATWLEELEAE